jgi:hypothetical protein
LCSRATIFQVCFLNSKLLLQLNFFKKKKCSYDCEERTTKMSRAREKDVSSSAGGFEANDVPLVLTRLLYNKQLALLYYTILFVRAREGRHI